MREPLLTNCVAFQRPQFLTDVKSIEDQPEWPLYDMLFLLETAI